MEPMSWQAPSFHYVEKSAAWYMWSIVVSVVVAALSLLQGNILFLFFVVIAEAVVLLLGKQKPRLLTYDANEKRVSVDTYREYPYAELKGFAIVEDMFNARYQELILLPAAKLSTRIKILVPVERAADLRTMLAQYLPEVPYEEPFSDNILKRIGL